jgi:hypothetical protein
LSRFSLRSSHRRIILQSLDHQVGLQIFQDLVVAEIREFRQVKDWLVRNDLISLVVLNLNDTLFDKVHFFYVRLVLNNCLAWAIDSTEHRND